jgi:hypothetical protein
MDSELPVPGREAVNRDGRRTGCPEIGTDLLRNRRFESISLQQRVRCEPDFILPQAAGCIDYRYRPVIRHPVQRPDAEVGRMQAAVFA